MGDWLQVSHPIAQLALAGDPDRRRTDRAILEKEVSTQLSQEAWVGLKTSSKRPSLLARKRWVSRER